MSNIKDIPFPNGKRAQSVTVSTDTPADVVISSLKIEKPKALILVLGGAAGLDESLKQRLLSLFSRGIARASIETGAIIIDGGTKAGVMELMGQAVADQGRKSILLGVAPLGKVTYPEGPAEGSIENGAPLDPDNSHFVLVDSLEWGGETEMMFKLAKTFARGIPAVTILANGGQISRKEILLSVRHGWPVIVLEGSGNLADEIARSKKQKPDMNEDPVIAEIIEEGDIHLFPIEGAVEDFKELIIRISVDPTLKLVWERFALFDDNAKKLQDNFNWMQKWILRLGVLATLFVLIKTQWQSALTPYNSIFSGVILLMPISITILVAAANKFKSGNKWILLRSGSEAIKREIYCYRARAWIYGEKQRDQKSCEAILTQRVEEISRRLMQTEINAYGLKPYTGKIPPDMYAADANDDGFSLLTSERYLTIRLGDQINYYQKKTEKLDKQLKMMQWSTYIIGGAGTFLAAIGLQLWIALTTTIVGTIYTYLEYQQTENTLIQYNQTKTNLEDIRSWWSALSAREKISMKDNLIEHTEKILHNELTGWVQQMENALTKLREQQGKAGKKVNDD